MTTCISELCRRMDSENASDLFVTIGRIPAFRKAGAVQDIPGTATITLEDTRAFLKEAFPADTEQRLRQELDMDLGITLPQAGRFRVNLSFQRGEISMAIRRIPSGAVDSRKLLIPDDVIHLADSARGLILVTGATSSGKSTTLAALLHHINATYRKHIVTIEDPIEFAHDDIQSFVSQREVGSDTASFATALKHVVRQNPDAIFIGEMRDMETVQTAINAALTGHLVAATMHTQDVVQTIDRILNYFPEGTRAQVAVDMSHVLLGIVSQRLLPASSGHGRVAAFEFLKATPLAQRLIKNREIASLNEVIRCGQNDGMTTFNQSIFQRLKDGLVSQDDALANSTDPDNLRLMIQGLETGVETLRSYSSDPDQGISIKKLLKTALHYGASDLLLTVDAPPTIRLDGELRPFDMPKLKPADTQKLLFSVLSYNQRADFEQNREIDFALAVKNLEINKDKGPEDFRFRVNGFYQKGGVAAAFRVIPTKIPTPEELGLPPAVIELCKRRQGLVLVTGPTGSGKSTTLAAMINVINRTRACHIITVEDPIEFVHTHQASVIEQREVHADTLSFANALKYVLRQDPDIILVGEMRDPETIATVLTAAETGHLVFATLHTNDVTQSVDRIIDVFPADRQNQVRAQLAACLEAVISQRLFKRANTQKGRVAAFEILLGTTAVKAMIRDKKTHQLLSTMESSAKDGMITMTRALQNLLQKDLISADDFAAAMPRSFETQTQNFL